MDTVKNIELPDAQEVPILFPEKKIRDFVIHLRKKQREIEQQCFFCNKHNFKLEAESKRNEAEAVQKIIHELEREFDLGFVWDSSLD